MHRTLSDIEEIINSTHSAELIPIKCQNCGSKIKASNLGKHSQCSIYRNHHTKSFLKREAFPLEIKLQLPTKLDMFIIGNTAKEGYQSIAPPLAKHHVQSLRILEPEPDIPIQLQSNVQYQVVEQIHEQIEDFSQFSINIQDKTVDKQNFDSLSLYSKKQELLPTTAREDRTARNYQQEVRVSGLSGISGNSGGYYSRQEITYRPTVTQFPQQINKQNSGLLTTRNSQNKGLFSIFSCTTQHGASIKQNQIIIQPLPANVCPCCLRQGHQTQGSSSQKLNNFQIQKKKILYDKWLQARARYKSIPSVSFQQAYKKYKYLQQQQFSNRIREYFY